MATTVVSPPAQPQVRARPRRRSTLDVVILVGLSIVILSDALGMVRDGRIVPPVVVFMSIYSVTGLIVLTGWRWSMFFPLIFCTLGLVGELSTGYPEFALTHPGANPPAFDSFVINYPLLIMVIVTSAVKLIQTLRREPLHLPGWMRPGIGLAVGVMVGALAIGSVAQGTSAASATAAKAGTETVHLTGAVFAPNIIALHSGDTLTIVDDEPVPHTITNGSWSASNQPQPGVEPGAPTISNVNLNNNTVTVGPFTTPGTYHLYCTVHPGMNLTVIVQ